MIWNNWHDFVGMGGYGFYVWGSYGVTLCLMAVELVVLGQRRRRAAALAARPSSRRRS